MFTHLHVHTEYSLLDGAARITNLVSKAKELGMNSLAITDHGNMFGAIKFYKECKKQGIKPILGAEVYVAERTRFDKDAKLDKHMTHLILLCKDEEGYRNLVKIVSNAYTEGFYYKPRTDKDDLKKYHKGLIATSACLAGSVQRLLLDGKYEEAKEEALEYQKIFGKGNFYLEVQNHGLKDDDKVLPLIKKLSKETNIPMVATNDVHYVEQSDARAQEVLLCMQTGKKLGESKLSFENDEFYLKSEKEMKTLFSSFEGAIESTEKIAKKCNVELKFGEYHIPKFDVPEKYKSEEEYFNYLCEKGFKERYGRGNKNLRERLSYEMDTIKNMGFIGYFLIVQDFINWAKERNIPTGFGRGSASGSIVSYCLKITNVDPIKYNLLFERFLNPERISMPDIDIDFCIRRREEVIDYVKENYGEERVCQISTFGTMKAKMAVKDVARVIGVPYSESDRIAKLIGEEDTIADALKQDELRVLYRTNQDVKEVIDMAMKLEGLPRQLGTHAAGVVIAPEDVSNFVPLAFSKKGIATEYTMTEIEELGLLKMDFLGLRNLTVIDDTLKMLKQNRGIDINLDELDYDDPNIYEYIGKGKTVGMFQLESQGITDFMKKLKPECFDDIVAGVSLYRPGPMDSIPKYLQNKRHQDKIVYDDPKLEPILKNTYGCIVYQEQVMRIVRDLAGYSFGRSDLIRRAMSKKKADVMAEEKEYFINGKLDKNGNIEVEGAVKRGTPKEIAEKIWDEMAAFASYAFNLSHSVAYSIITYQTAWLKYYYPSEFMASLMTSSINNPEHLETFIKDARKINYPGEHRRIRVLPPSVFTSQGEFSVNEDGDINYGLYAIKNVGKAIVDNIALIDKERIKNNFQGFLQGIDRKNLNSKAVQGLIDSGALNGVVPNVHTATTYLDKYLESVKNNGAGPDQISFFELNKEFEEAARFNVKELEEYPEEKLLELEKNALGTYLSKHPLDKYKTYIKDNITVSTDDLLDGLYDDKSVLDVGIVASKKEITTKHGERMAFLNMETVDGNYEAIVFPKPFKSFRPLVNQGKVVALLGTAQNGKILVSEMSDLKDIAFLKAHTILRDGVVEEKVLKLRVPEMTNEVREILDSFPGKNKVLVYLKGEKNARVYKNMVTKGNLLMLKLGAVVGEGNIK